MRCPDCGHTGRICLNDGITIYDYCEVCRLLGGTIKTERCSTCNGHGEVREIEGEHELRLRAQELENERRMIEIFLNL